MLVCLAILLAISSTSGQDVSTTALPTSINKQCFSNNDCPLDRTYCKVASPSCGRGTCQCIPGYGFDSQSQTCKRAIAGVGTSCNPISDICTGRNVFCSNQTNNCTCPTSYHGGRDGDCVPVVMTKSLGAPCSDDMECYNDLHCLDGRCGCAPGFKPYKSVYCVKKSAMDPCSSPQDCINAPNTGCSSDGICACLTGYKNITYWTGVDTQTAIANVTIVYKYRTGVFNTACIKNEVALQPEGAICTSPSIINAVTTSNSINQTTFTYCTPPFVCTACGKNDMTSQDQRYVCSVMPLSFTDGGKMVQGLSTLIAIAIAAIISLV